MKAGRTSTITEKVLAKLEEAYAMCCTDKEACLLAAISTDALYRYQVNNPDFAVRKQQLKLYPNMTAKFNIVDAIQRGDVKVSMWYLEKKSPDEFGKK